MIEKEYLAFCDSFPLAGANMVSRIYLLRYDEKPELRKWVPARAAWDTGATFCCISRDLCSRLGIRPFRKEYVRSFSCPEGVRTHYENVIINFSKGPYVISTLAHVIDTMPDDYDMLIGKVVIASGKFSLTVNDDRIDLRLEIDPHYKFLKIIKNSPEFHRR